MEGAIAAKRQALKAFKAWKVCKGTKETYCWAKRIARRKVHHAPQDAGKAVFEDIGPKSSENFRLANQMSKENADVVGDKPIKNDAGELSMSEEAKQKAWLDHYQRFFDVESEWDPQHLSAI